MAKTRNRGKKATSHARKPAARRVAAPADPVTSYAQAVIAGTLPASKRHRQACERHLRDLKRQRTAAFPYYFDLTAVDDTLEFYAHCKHSKGEWAGQPFVPAQWQQFGIGSLFGWKRVTDGLRRYKRVYDQEPRKNGKSTKVAPIAIRCTFFDGEDGADGYSFATKKDQARVSFDAAKSMVITSPELRSRLKWLTSNIHMPSTSSKFEPLGADEDTLDGLNVHFAIGDEVHAMKTRGLIDVIETAMGARRQPLMYLITTPGFDRHSICYEIYSYACSVLDQSITDETFFAFIADMDDEDDWMDPRAWAKSNPGLGLVGRWLWDGATVDEALARESALRTASVAEMGGDQLLGERLFSERIGGSVKLQDLDDLARKAQSSLAAQNTFRRLRLGQWTEQSVRAIPMDQWDECRGKKSWQELRESFEGRKGGPGLDLATRSDIAGAVWLLEATDEPGAYDVVPDMFIPEERIDSRREAQRIRQFVEQGALTATEGNIIDYGVIRQHLNDTREQLDRTDTVGYDPWNATQLAQQLKDEDGFDMLEIRQGTRSMGEPTKLLLSLIATKKIRHGGHPLLRWMASNFATKEDSNGNLCPDKSRSSEKIDGIVALIIRLACLVAQPAAPVKKKSVYATRLASVVTAAGVQALQAPSVNGKEQP